MRARRDERRTFSQDLLRFLLRDALNTDEVLLRGICDGLDGVEPCIFEFLDVVRVDAGLLQLLDEHGPRDLKPLPPPLPVAVASVERPWYSAYYGYRTQGL